MLKSFKICNSLFKKADAKKPKKKLINENSKRIKAIWSFSFLPYGLEIFEGNVGGGKKIIILSLAVTQIITLLHQVISIFFTISVDHSIAKLSFYASLLVSSFISVYSLWMMYRRRKPIAKLLKSTMEHVNNNTKGLKGLWKCSSVSFLGLSFLNILETACAAIDVITQDDEVIENYAAMYFFGARLPNYTWFTRTVISIEFVIVLLISSQFVTTCVCFFTFLCHTVFYRFQWLNTNFELLLTNGRPPNGFDLCEYRNKHQSIDKDTKELSYLWSPLIVFWLLGFILTICFDLRALWFGNSTLFMIGFVIDFLRNLWLVVGLFNYAALIGDEAHRLRDQFITLQVSTPNTAFINSDQLDYYVNYLLLSERLVNTKIGINASGLFLLNASSFLSMTATVLTYVIVLYQTK